ncbi:hypothetical protein BpHYR1_023689 [Brachionus plicatilis]|uniref:Uncharacterized protein n=1 Tax=Brachionus plicatilis TaxID=10195 RepID=A0A3M7PKD6_BRAPC|nr:hypothetical protein BpHYR1_023689 [Brachionus plicatilis]
MLNHARSHKYLAIITTQVSRREKLLQNFASKAFTKIPTGLADTAPKIRTGTRMFETDIT